MEKRICLFSIFLITISAVSAFAGGAVNRTNWSAEYIRTLNRNAATDYADIVLYNPAGTVHMNPGGYVNVSAHYFTKRYKNDITTGPFEGTYRSNEPSVVPGLFTVYNADQWALYFGVSNMLGGGKVDFKDGNLTTATIGAGVIQATPYDAILSQNIKAEQQGLGYTVGGAIQLNDNISLSMGIRYVDAKKEARGGATLVDLTGPAPDLTGEVDYEWDAQGIGAILGINYTPTPNTTIAARYETRTSLRYRYTVIADDFDVLANQGINTGTKRREDLPAVLGIGVSQQFSPKFRVASSLTYYFNSDADWDGDHRKFNNGYDVGLALEYAFTPELLGSVGYMYTDIGIKSRYKDDIFANRPENPNLDAHTVGFGGAYWLRPDLAFNAAAGRVFYDDDDISTPIGDVTYEKVIYFLAFGVQYKFM